MLSADLERILQAHADEIEHPNPDLAVDLGLRATLATLGALDDPASRDGRAGRLSGEELTRELTRLLKGYLTLKDHPETTEGATRQMEFFDIWG